MCGIAGIINHESDKEYVVENVVSMLNSIAHRGPDEYGYYVNDHLALGNVRLSIIDLKNGTQPFCDKTKKCWLSYNGELYNYIEIRNELISRGIQFQTSSDTEVVLYSLKEFGIKALDKFNGSFAFAYYDGEEVILARDKFGKRPLFYYKKNNTVSFSSEIKAFMELSNLELNEVAVMQALGTWSMLPDETVFTNVKQVKPGSYLRVGRNRVEEKTYFSYSSCIDHSLSTEEASEKTLEKLKSAVGIRLRSDVEVGCYLSGGLDSSIITYLAGQNTSKLKTFSISFADNKYDESYYQSLLASHLNHDHTTIKISNQDIVDNFSKAIWHSESPSFRTAFVPMYLLSKKVKEEKIKVVLTGEGADEMFGGYNIFKEAQLLTNWNSSRNERALKKLYPYLENGGRDALAMIKKLDNSSKQRIFKAHNSRFQMLEFSKRLLCSKSNPLKRLQEYLERQSINLNNLSLFTEAQHVENNTLLHGYLLSTQGDRMSMAQGIEVRCPFLDPNVVAFASKLPESMKIDDSFNEKFILKHAFRNKLPRKIINRAKTPYRAPDSSAFLNSKNNEYLDLIYDEISSKKISFLNHSFIEKFISKIKSNRSLSKTSQREDMTFISLVSLLYLHKIFIKRQGIPTLQKLGKLTRRTIS